jgi:hypothetical protein
LALQMSPNRRALRRTLRRLRNWIRSRYGVRDLILPEKYRVDERHDIVVTYSSSLALLYFASTPKRLDLDAIVRDRSRAHLYAELLRHPGIGLVATMSGPAVHVESARGRAMINDGALEIIGGANPLEPYGTEPVLALALERLVRQHNAGDLVLFGAYDGYEIVCFDDQVGAHGAAGGNQLYPFLVAHQSLGLEQAELTDARDLHRELMSKYATAGAALEPRSALNRR